MSKPDFVQIEHDWELITIKIKEFYKTAGKRYKWNGSSLGIGLDSQVVLKAKQLGYRVHVEVRGQYNAVYTPDEIIDFSIRHNSRETIKGTSLLIVKWKDPKEVPK